EKAIENAAKHLSRPGSLATPEAIDETVDQLIRELTVIAEDTTPKRGRNPPKGGPSEKYWNYEVNRASKASKRPEKPGKEDQPRPAGRLSERPRTLSTRPGSKQVKPYGDGESKRLLRILRSYGPWSVGHGYGVMPHQKLLKCPPCVQEKAFHWRVHTDRKSN